MTRMTMAAIPEALKEVGDRYYDKAKKATIEPMASTKNHSWRMKSMRSPFLGREELVFICYINLMQLMWFTPIHHI